MRKKMPYYSLAAVKMQIEQLDQMVMKHRAGQRGEMAEMTDEFRESQLRLIAAGKEMFKNFPIWMLTTGLFMSANLYAMLALSQQAR